MAADFSMLSKRLKSIGWFPKRIQPPDAEASEIRLVPSHQGEVLVQRGCGEQRAYFKHRADGLQLPPERPAILIFTSISRSRAPPRSRRAPSYRVRNQPYQSTKRFCSVLRPARFRSRSNNDSSPTSSISPSICQKLFRFFSSAYNSASRKILRYSSSTEIPCSPARFFRRRTNSSSRFLTNSCAMNEYLR
jgi:hypothetical protein